MINNKISSGANETSEAAQDKIFVEDANSLAQ